MSGRRVRHAACPPPLKELMPAAMRTSAGLSAWRASVIQQFALLLQLQANVYLKQIAVDVDIKTAFMKIHD
ncbi:hypothetical protein D3C78_1046710 [compost metagenome]